MTTDTSNKPSDLLHKCGGRHDAKSRNSRIDYEDMVRDENLVYGAEVGCDFPLPVQR